MMVAMPITIISYNIWDLPLWFVKNRAARIREIGKYLAASAADIICIQESWDIATRKTLYDALGNAGYHHASASESHILVGNAGLVTFSKFPIISRAFRPYSRMSSYFVELFTARGILETVVKTPKGLLRILNTHLHMPSRFLDTRIRLSQMRRAFERLGKPDGLASILAGDFNEHEIMRQSAFAKILDAEGFDHPFDDRKEALTSSYRKENIFVNTWINAIRESKRYDYIFTRNLESLGYAVESYRPVYMEPELSDHDPVLLVLREA